MASPNTKALRCSPWTAVKSTSPLAPGALSSSHKNIHQLINEKCAELATPWKGSIIFPVYPVHDKKDDLKEVFSKPPVEQDICLFFNGEKSLEGNNRLYFCPVIYPPPCESDSKEERQKKLSSINIDLQNAARACGSPIIIGKGGGKARPGTHIYQCDYCYRSANASNDSKPDISHRLTHLTNNDKSGRRKGIGKSGSKRVNVTNKSIVCPFNFTLRSDEHGFYITLARQAGNAEHLGHPLFDPDTTPISTRHLSQEEIEDAKYVMESTLNKATGRNFLKAKYDINLSYAQVAYLDSLGKDDVEDEYESLFTMLENAEDVRYNILWSKPSVNGNGIETVSSTSISDDIDHANINDAAELTAVAATIEEERKGQNISEDRQVFHSIAWSNEKVFRYFKLNPEVVTCDVTSHTNRSGYHLLTFSVRTAIDKQVVFLRIWIPDQTRSSFRYVFQEVLTKLIPEHIREKVMFFMKDGDPQQGKELVESMKMHFPNAEQGGCGYHIVNMGWNRHVKGCNCVPDENLDLWKRIIRCMHKWMYTWMRPGYCESEDEYQISKQLLLHFVSSNYVWNVTGGNGVLIQSILRFLRNHVFVNENQYLYFRRKHIRNFEVSHSSAHEGTNFGLKSHAAAVQPTMALHTAAAAMGVQDNMKAAQCDFIVHRDFRNSNKKWSPWPTAPYLTTYGEGVLMQSYSRSSQYKARRVGENQFQVVYIGKGCDNKFVKLFFDECELTATGCEGNAPEKPGDGLDDASTSIVNSITMCDSDVVGGMEAKAPTLVSKDSRTSAESTLADEASDSDDISTVNGDIDGFDISDCAVPLFNRSHLVTLGKESKCSCCRHERIGMFCPHIVCCAKYVCSELGKVFDGFTHESIAVRWWSSYMYYGYKEPKNTTEAQLVQLFHAQSLNDTRGPCFEYNIPNTVPILDQIPEISAIDRLKNYPKEAVPSTIMDKFDGIYSCDHSPNTYQDYEKGLLTEEAIARTLKSLNTTCTDQFFESSVSNATGAHEPGVGTRSSLYPLWNQITNAHDQLKDEEWDKEFEKMLRDHLTKTNAKLRKEDSSNNSADSKRKFEPITTERYTGSAKRVYNTKRHQF